MNGDLRYLARRNVGTVGRPPVACAVCNFSPSRHVLSAWSGLEVAPDADKGLCNVHAQGLVQNQTLSPGQLDTMRSEWRASRP